MVCQTVCAHPALAGHPGEGERDPYDQLTDELNDAQMAELFALLLQEPQEQQLPPSTAPLACQDLLPAVPPDVLEFSSAEDALDAKILQLLALKEAAVQQRQQRQQHELMLLQQQLAAVDPAATADTATKQQHQVSARGQALDVGPDLQLRLTTCSSLPPCDATWQWHQGISAGSSRASLDLGCLQDRASFEAMQPAMPAQLGQHSSLAVLTPCSTAAAATGPCTATGLQADGCYSMVPAAALTAHGSSSALLCPHSMCATVMPAPAVGTVLSLVGPMASLQDQPVLAVQQCSVSTAAPAGALFVAGYPSHLPSAVQVQGCSSGAGQAMGAVVSGVVGLRSASFSGVSPFAHEAAPATQAGLQPCSVYVHSSYAGCNQLLQPMSPGVAVGAPGVQRSMRCADPRNRRMSADSPGFRSVTVARVPAAALLGSAYPDSSSMMSHAGPQVASAARMGSGPLPALATGAGAAAGLPSQQNAQAGAGMAAGRRSMDVHRSASAAAAAGENDPVGMLCAVAAPSWAGPSWHPKADLDSTQPAKKGTGVFMPRTAA